eukprot:TRINITY_DN1265_c0_g1_i1.p1 TRINITY_DN1265_c0_g1~~TRINITY_DN1265_c0_g1_i1.p1  ORF type:complete len:1855 (+),score=344.90 TRINITY_DN1265_c0_g1_i1:42-5567(+)
MNVWCDASIIFHAIVSIIYYLKRRKNFPNGTFDSSSFKWIYVFIVIILCLYDIYISIFKISILYNDKIIVHQSIFFICIFFVYQMLLWNVINHMFDKQNKKYENIFQFLIMTIIILISVFSIFIKKFEQKNVLIIFPSCALSLYLSRKLNFNQAISLKDFYASIMKHKKKLDNGHTMFGKDFNNIIIYERTSLKRILLILTIPLVLNIFEVYVATNDIKNVIINASVYVYSNFIIVFFPLKYLIFHPFILQIFVVLNRIVYEIIVSNGRNSVFISLLVSYSILFLLLYFANIYYDTRKIEELKFFYSPKADTFKSSIIRNRFLNNLYVLFFLTFVFVCLLDHFFSVDFLLQRKQVIFFIFIFSCFFFIIFIVCRLVYKELFKKVNLLIDFTLFGIWNAKDKSIWSESIFHEDNVQNIKKKKLTFDLKNQIQLWLAKSIFPASFKIFLIYDICGTIILEILMFLLDYIFGKYLSKYFNYSDNHQIFTYGSLILLFFYAYVCAFTFITLNKMPIIVFKDDFSTQLRTFFNYVSFFKYYKYLVIFLKSIMLIFIGFTLNDELGLIICYVIVPGIHTSLIIVITMNSKKMNVFECFSTIVLVFPWICRFFFQNTGYDQYLNPLLCFVLLIHVFIYFYALIFSFNVTISKWQVKNVFLMLLCVLVPLFIIFVEHFQSLYNKLLDTYFVQCVVFLIIFSIYLIQCANRFNTYIIHVSNYSGRHSESHVFFIYYFILIYLLEKIWEKISFSFSIPIFLCVLFSIVVIYAILNLHLLDSTLLFGKDPFLKNVYFGKGINPIIKFDGFARKTMDLSKNIQLMFITLILSCFFFTFCFITIKNILGQLFLIILIILIFSVTIMLDQNKTTYIFIIQHLFDKEILNVLAGLFEGQLFYDYLFTINSKNQKGNCYSCDEMKHFKELSDLLFIKRNLDFNSVMNSVDTGVIEEEKFNGSACSLGSVSGTGSIDSLDSIEAMINDNSFIHEFESSTRKNNHYKIGGGGGINELYVMDRRIVELEIELEKWKMDKNLYRKKFTKNRIKSINAEINWLTYHCKLIEGEMFLKLMTTIDLILKERHYRITQWKEANNFYSRDLLKSEQMFNSYWEFLQQKFHRSSEINVVIGETDAPEAIFTNGIVDMHDDANEDESIPATHLSNSILMRKNKLFLSHFAENEKEESILSFDNPTTTVALDSAISPDQSEIDSQLLISSMSVPICSSNEFNSPNIDNNDKNDNVDRETMNLESNMSSKGSLIDSKEKEMVLAVPCSSGIGSIVDIGTEEEKVAAYQETNQKKLRKYLEKLSKNSKNVKKMKQKLSMLHPNDFQTNYREFLALEQKFDEVYSLVVKLYKNSDKSKIDDISINSMYNELKNRFNELKTRFNTIHCTNNERLSVVTLSFLNLLAKLKKNNERWVDTFFLPDYMEDGKHENDYIYFEDFSSTKDLSIGLNLGRNDLKRSEWINIDVVTFINMYFRQLKELIVRYDKQTGVFILKYYTFQDEYMFIDGYFLKNSCVIENNESLKISIFPAILEKLLAKLSGSYQALKSLKLNFYTLKHLFGFYYKEWFCQKMSIIESLDCTNELAAHFNDFNGIKWLCSKEKEFFHVIDCFPVDINGATIIFICLTPLNSRNFINFQNPFNNHSIMKSKKTNDLLLTRLQTQKEFFEDNGLLTSPHQPICWCRIEDLLNECDSIIKYANIMKMNSISSSGKIKKNNAQVYSEQNLMLHLVPQHTISLKNFNSKLKIDDTNFSSSLNLIFEFSQLKMDILVDFVLLVWESNQTPITNENNEHFLLTRPIFTNNRCTRFCLNVQNPNFNSYITITPFLRYGFQMNIPYNIVVYSNSCGMVIQKIA